MMTRFMKVSLCLIVIALSLVILPLSAQESDTPIWRASDDIRALLLDAQRQLFSAQRADNPTELYESAQSMVEQAHQHYVDVLQTDIQRYATPQDEQITQLFDDAKASALRGDLAQLSFLRGYLWTLLLHASYSVTMGAIEAGEYQNAENWLSLREYRQATRVNIVLNPAATAVQQLSQQTIQFDEALAQIDNDLRDAYYFRMRQALSELETALDNDYWVRSSEWLGQIYGYFGLFATDYGQKIGNVDDLQIVLEALETAILATDKSSADTYLAEFRLALTNYQPIALSQEQIGERGQLLYIFTDLVYVEYKDGVRNGQITVPIEYQEATTFLAQARSLYEELRPIMSQSDSAQTEQLAVYFANIDTLVQSYGDSSEVRVLVDESKKIITATLPLNLTGSTTAMFTVITTLLDEIEQSIADGRYIDAEQTRLQAYALFDFGPEQKLLAFAPDLAFQIESLFWYGDTNGDGLARIIATRQSSEAFEQVRTRLDDTLNEAQVILGASTQPLTIIFNSAVIVFREGLEAVVIIAALSAGMTRVNKQYRRPLFVGALSALLLTLFTWVIADSLLWLFRDLGERLEAIVSVIALGVLLLITNWFFHKTYWVDHMAGLHQQKGQILRGESGKYIGLIILGFTSVYREGFETVLFLQALVLDAGVLVVIQGVLLGMLGVTIVGVITFRLQTRLPYMRMLIITGILIVMVLVVLVGNTMRVFQVVGWMPIHPIDGVTIPYWLGQWFGVYPTWEGMIAQFGAVIFVIGSYFLAQHIQQRKRDQLRRQRAVQV